MLRIVEATNAALRVGRHDPSRKSAEISCCSGEAAIRLKISEARQGTSHEAAGSHQENNNEGAPVKNPKGRPSKEVRPE